MRLLQSKAFWLGFLEGFALPFTFYCRVRHAIGVRAPYWNDNLRWTMAYCKRLTPKQRTALRRQRRLRAKERMNAE